MPNDPHSEPQSAASGAQAWYRRLMPPEDELPYTMPIPSLTARGSDAALAITGIKVFTNGLTLDVAVRLRRLVDLGNVPRLPEGLGNRQQPPSSKRDQNFWMRVEYADGRTATNIAAPSLPRTSLAADEPTLTPNGGRGGQLSADKVFWLTPLPPDGRVTFVCAWLELGIPETRFALDDAELSTAGARANQLWAN